MFEAIENEDEMGYANRHEVAENARIRNPEEQEIVEGMKEYYL